MTVHADVETPAAIYGGFATIARQLRQHPHQNHRVPAALK